MRLLEGRLTRDGKQHEPSVTAAGGGGAGARARGVARERGRGRGRATLRRREGEGEEAVAIAAGENERRAPKGSMPSPSSSSSAAAARAAFRSAAALPANSLLVLLLVTVVSSCCLGTSEAFVLPGMTATTSPVAPSSTPGLRSTAVTIRRAAPGTTMLLQQQQLWPSQLQSKSSPKFLPAVFQRQRRHQRRLEPAFESSGWRAADCVSGRRGAVARGGLGVSRRDSLLSMMAASGAATSGVGGGVPSGGGRAGGGGGAVGGAKALVLAIGTLLVSVQPAILVLATKAVAKLVASCGIGYYCSKKGILDQSAITSLSKLIFFVFQPCLLFVNVASTLGTPGQKLSKLLVLPAFAILQILFGSAVGKVMEKLLRLKAGSPEARELRMCTSFANSGPLPLLFVDSIFGSHPDTSIVSSAVAYISFYLLGWSPMFWTAGYTMVAGEPQKAAPISEADAQHFEQLSLLRKLVVTMHRIKASPTFKRIASPPVLGCIAGMIAGLMPWCRTLLLGRSAPLSPVYDAIKGLGSAYLPAAILVLAGSLARPSGPRVVGATQGEAGEGEGAASLYKPETKSAFYKKIAAIMASRFLAMPLIAAILLLTGARANLIPYDKLVWFVLLMEGCMPSAQNSVVILQMEKKPELASSMAKTLTAVYLLSAVPIAFLLSAILQFVQL